MDARHAGIKRDADNIQIVTGIGDELFLRYPTYGLNLVADPRCLFKFQRLAGLFHAGNQLSQYLIVFARQEQAHVVDLLGILFLAHQSGDARPQTAANLILQTRPRTVAIDAVLTLADREDFLQQR